MKQIDRPDIHLRGYLRAYGLNVNEAVSITGFNRNKMSAILNGRQEPTIDDIITIAEKVSLHQHQRRGSLQPAR